MGFLDDVTSFSRQILKILFYKIYSKNQSIFYSKPINNISEFSDSTEFDFRNPRFMQTVYENLIK